MHSRSRNPLRPIFLAVALLAAAPLAGQDSARSNTPTTAPPAATSPAASPATATPATAAAAESTGAKSKAAAARGDTATRGSHRDAEFPQPLELALLLVALFGMLGAFAGDLVADEFSIATVRRNTEGWNLGWVGRLVVGAVAALVTVNVNPPEGWATLIGTAAAAGVAGEAILKSIASSRRAELESKGREIAEVEAEKNERAAEHAGAREQLAVAYLNRIAGIEPASVARSPSDVHASAREHAALSGRGGGDAPAPSGRELSEYARHALAELQRHARPSER